MHPDPHAIQIAVDGSCFVDSKRESGYAGFVLYPDNTVEEQIVFHGVRESTINRMELAACIAAMKWIRQIRPATSRVQIFSDSRYVIDNISRAPYWQKSGWRNAQGRPMENPDLWKEFLSARSKAGVRVDFGWVKGKSSSLLKKVDKTAKEAALSGTAIDHGYTAGKIGRPKTKGGNPTMFPASGQIVAIRTYGSTLVGKSDENKIKFEIYDEATNRFGPKHFAYAEPEVGSQLHRQWASRVQMNDNPKYPQVLAVLERITLPRAKKLAAKRGRAKHAGIA